MAQPFGQQLGTPAVRPSLRDIFDEVRTPMQRPPVAAINSPKVYTLGELVTRPHTEVPCLLKPLLPRQGLVVLAGASDTGKSSILRQLALSVALGTPTFLDFPLNTQHQRAICVSTEDGDEAVGPMLKMQLQGQALDPDAHDRLRFIFEVEPENLPKQLDRMLTAAPADLIVLDALGDLYGGNLNASNDVRHFLTAYSNLAQKHGCLVLFMHHTGKRTDEREPSKHNLLGSQGLEAKMRVAFELRADPYAPDIRHLCVLKGNYLPSDVKGASYALRFDENLLFHNTGQRAAFSDLIKAPQGSEDERELWREAESFLSAGNSFEKTAELLKPVAQALGVKPPSKSALGRRYPKASHVPPSQTLTNGMVGRGTNAADLSDDETDCLFLTGNTATTAELLNELRAHHYEKGDPMQLLDRLQQQRAIVPAASGRDRWRRLSNAA
jgi:hypothetical protein